MEHYTNISEPGLRDVSSIQSICEEKCKMSAKESKSKYRAPLGNLTNRPICRSKHGKSIASKLRPADSSEQNPATTQSASNVQVIREEDCWTLVDKRPFPCSCLNTLVNNRVQLPVATQSRKSRCKEGTAGGYIVSDSLNESLSYEGPLCKRSRVEFTEAEFIHTTNFSPPTEGSEIDRRPFVSKLACDIVRAAFAERVQLEHFLSECRRSDYAIAALDRSPVDRMMEATDYIVGIMAYEQIRERKECFRVSDFLAASKQPNLTADMLTTLADWLIDVQEIFAYNHETIHLAWGIFYAFLDRGRPLARREIQLMACAALMVSLKHEESGTSRMNELLFITDGVYKREEFIDAERNLLVAIDFAVHRPNPYVFLRRYARVLDAHSGLVQYMSRFLLEAGMHSHKITLKRESRKAAAVLWLARVVLRNPSYMEWIHRPDVAQLRHFIRTNPAAKQFYESCPRAELKRPAYFEEQYSICPDTGALDLSNCSFSSVLSRTASISQSPWVPSVENTISWIPPDFSEHAVDGIFTQGDTSNQSPIDSTASTITDLDPAVKAELEAMRSEEDQRAPYWPPILEHITGYKESDLIPLATRYHQIAMRLIAEAARGSRLATDGCTRDTSGPKSTFDDEETDPDSSNSAQHRSVSPGGHHLRRHAVTKYCADAFLKVADAYPQLAFENFVSNFPAMQCPDSCSCFICVNLIQRS